MNVLQINNLNKSFQNKQVLKDISFTIKPNRIVGLLGKNGCGKTTILKIVNDLLTKDSGSVLVMGNPISVETKKLISYLPERSYLDSDSKVIEVIKFFETFYSDFNKDKARKLLKELGLDENARLAKMSKGMKEKVGLVLVMSRSAKLYVLDEPLGGVDPATRDVVLKTILSNFDDGASMLITTHIISDVESILDDVIFINDGKIILQGEAETLREEHGASIDEIFRRLLK
ncbi:MAG: ABC transporter ATP-binding protein [Clostridia bacterium]|nr:ABC transporter ATP-binding protein [Clostridia bacterium]